MRAADACAAFVAEIQGCYTPRWLTLTGAPGSGKTMLARQILEAADQFNPGASALWVDESQVNGKGKRRPLVVWLDASAMAERMKGKEFDLPEYLADDFLVVLDDLGAARDQSSFIADATYRLCNARRDRWTVFTSNLTMNEIATRIDERVASRLIRDSNVLVTMNAQDYALRPKAAGKGPVPPVAVLPLDPPIEWQGWVKTQYPDDSWADSASKLPWASLPRIWQLKIRREMAPV